MEKMKTNLPDGEVGGFTYKPKNILLTGGAGFMYNLIYF